MMNLSPYRRGGLFSLMDDLERSFFNDSVSGTSGFRTDIKEKDGAYTLEAELPGFDAKDINIDLNGDTLTISAQHESTNDEKDENGNYIRRERRFGSFSRSFDVTGIDTDKIEASYQNGVLKLNMPQKAQLQPQSRKIAIGQGNEPQKLETTGEQQGQEVDASASDAPVQ